MKAIIIAIVLSVIFSSHAYADDWTWKDTAWQSATIASLVVDWGQTRYRSTHGFKEYNPLIGNQSSADHINLYFLVSIVAHTTIAYMLPSKTTLLDYEINPRRIWQISIMSLQIGCIGNNVRMGVGMEF